MSTNIEIKAFVSDPDLFIEEVTGLADQQAVTLRQIDTYFHCPNGRLKLRESDGHVAELIAYDRPDRFESGLSDYQRLPVDRIEDLKTVLIRALGLRGVVKKKRWLYHYGQTRIHVDRVDDLGNFMELEAVLVAGQAPQDGHRMVRELMARLNIVDTDLVCCSYIDMIESLRGKRSSSSAVQVQEYSP